MNPTEEHPPINGEPLLTWSLPIPATLFGACGTAMAEAAAREGYDLFMATSGAANVVYYRPAPDAVTDALGDTT